MCRVHQTLNRGKSVLHDKYHFEAERDLPNGRMLSPIALHINDGYSEEYF